MSIKLAEKMPARAFDDLSVCRRRSCRPAQELEDGICLTVYPVGQPRKEGLNRRNRTEERERIGMSRNAFCNKELR